MSNEELKPPEEEMNKYPMIAIGTSCFICGKIFDVNVIDDSAKRSKIGLKDIPVRMTNIPGFVHRRCRGETTSHIISNPVSKEDLTGMLNEL